ncbi:MAG: hypothetical protein ACKVT2_09115 [Saprospiraceae bacterium]
MKKHGTFQASSNLFGFLLLICLFGTVAMTSFDAVTDLYMTFKSQWSQFGENLSLMQPHRTVFP